MSVCLSVSLSLSPSPSPSPSLYLYLYIYLYLYLYVYLYLYLYLYLWLSVYTFIAEHCPSLHISCLALFLIDLIRTHSDSIFCKQLFTLSHLQAFYSVHTISIFYDYYIISLEALFSSNCLNLFLGTTGKSTEFWDYVPGKMYCAISFP